MLQWQRDMLTPGFVSEEVNMFMRIVFMLGTFLKGLRDSVCVGGGERDFVIICSLCCFHVGA